MTDNPSGTTRIVGPFEVRLLAGIRALGPAATGAGLKTWLEEKLERQVAVAQIYLALPRLIKRGLIDFDTLPPEARRGGRSRRLFRLTPAGEASLDHVSRIILNDLELVTAADPRPEEAEEPDRGGAKPTR